MILKLAPLLLLVITALIVSACGASQPESTPTPTETTSPPTPIPTSTPEPAFGDVIPEPPSPMAEAYIGRSPRLTHREAEQHNLEPAPDLTVPEPEAMPIVNDVDMGAPIQSAAPEAAEFYAEPAAPIAAAPQEFSAATSAQESLTDDASLSEFEDYDGAADRTDFDAQDPMAFQTPTPKSGNRLVGLRSAASTALGNSSTVVRGITSKTASGAKSLVANVAPLWQKSIMRVARLASKAPSLPNITASSGVGVNGRVSRLPAYSLLTPQMGSLAASARADASHARPDANVRPLRNEGVAAQEPEPKRTLLARKIQDNVERTETRSAAPSGPITQSRQGRMALSSLALIVVTLALLAGAAWVTVSIIQRTNTPITTIGSTERHRIEAVLEALFIDPGAVDGVIDARTTAAIAAYASEYGYTGPQEISTGLLEHLEAEAEAMGVLDLIR